MNLTVMLVGGQEFKPLPMAIPLFSDCILPGLWAVGAPGNPLNYVDIKNRR